MNYLREWQLSDAGNLAEGIGNKKVQENLRDGIPHPYTKADGEEFIQSTLAAPAGSQYSWAIQWEGKTVGSIGIFRQGNIHCRTVELGYWLAEPYAPVKE